MASRQQQVLSKSTSAFHQNSRKQQCIGILQVGMQMTAPLVVGTLAVLFSLPARAEGSREMVADGGDRPFTEWASGTTAGISRQTLLQVFVNAGETINLGSSVHTSATSPNDIVYRTPSGQAGACNVSATTGFGWISTLAQETAGPRLNTNGYIPCTVIASETGIYEVEFHAPTTSGNPTPTSATVAFPTGTTQQSGVAAWDITVRDAIGRDQTGRVFTDYIAMNLGSNGRRLASDFYIQTWDGYLYRTDMNGVDPFGFIFFANSRGFIDADGSTLYHSTKATSNALSPFQGNIVIQNPTVANDPLANSFTHLVFFNLPDRQTLDALNIPRVASAPAVPSDFRFIGVNNNDNRTLVGVGGHFEFTATSGSSYQIILDTNVDGVFDSTTDRVLEDTLTPGNNRVFWDGKDINGVELEPLPNNARYQAQISIRSGEYHFPMLDAENNPNGFIIEMLNAPGAFPSILDQNNMPVGRFTIYYDDNNYVTSNGTTVDLSGAGATSPRSAIRGTDSQTFAGEHEFNSNYGDFKGIDTWSFFPSSAVFSDVLITTAITDPNVLLVKRLTAINDAPITGFVDGVDNPASPNYVSTSHANDDNHALWPIPSTYLRGAIYSNQVRPGDELEYTIYFLSNGDSNAQDVWLCDAVPANTHFIADAYSGRSPQDAGGLVNTAMGIALGFDAVTLPQQPTLYLTNVADGDRALYFSPGTLPTVPCFDSASANTNGVIAVNLTPNGNPLPQAQTAGNPTYAYGFLRFRVRVE